VLLAAIALGMAVIVQAAARAVSGPPLPLRTIADIPLAGGSSRMDYESLDQRAGLLFIAHLGAGMVSVLDTRSNRIVANIPHVAGVHGVLAVPTLGRRTLRPPGPRNRRQPRTSAAPRARHRRGSPPD
jgi:hypothetical protein